MLKSQRFKIVFFLLLLSTNSYSSSLGLNTGYDYIELFYNSEIKRVDLTGGVGLGFFEDFQFNDPMLSLGVGYKLLRTDKFTLTPIYKGSLCYLINNTVESFIYINSLGLKASYGVHSNINLSLSLGYRYGESKIVKKETGDFIKTNYIEEFSVSPLLLELGISYRL